MRVPDYCTNCSNRGIGCSSKLGSLPPWERDNYDDFEDHGLECTCETCLQNHPEREVYDYEINKTT